MKAWGKAHNINSPKDRTLSSLSLLSLVVFHLQTRDPPILPPFSALFKDGTDPASVTRTVHNYLDYGKKNKESLAELFITLLIKLESVEKLWDKGLCASLYEGSWTSKSWDSQLNSISVEDFSERSQNVARAVGRQEVKKIYRCVHHSLGYLLTFLGGQMQRPTLRKFLFGVDTISTRLGKKDAISTLQYTSTRNLVFDENRARLPVPSNARPTKKMRLMEGWEGQQLVEGWGRKQQYDAWGQKQQGESWGGIQHSNGGGQSQQVKGKTFCNGTSQCTPQVFNQISPFASCLDNNLCYGPSKLPSAPTQNPIGLEGSHGHLLPQPIFSPQTSLWFGASHSQDPIFPNQYPGQINSSSLQNWLISCLLLGSFH